jgi:hypothetical protein
LTEAGLEEIRDQLPQRKEEILSQLGLIKELPKIIQERMDQILARRQTRNSISKVKYIG